MIAHNRLTNKRMNLEDESHVYSCNFLADSDSPTCSEVYCKNKLISVFLCQDMSESQKRQKQLKRSTVHNFQVNIRFNLASNIMFDSMIKGHIDFYILTEIHAFGSGGSEPLLLQLSAPTDTTGSCPIVT